MKKLSDFKGEEAIELWTDLLDPISVILTDDDFQKVVRSGQSRIVIAKEILKSHKKEAVEIMLRVDPEPIDGLNIVLRLVGLLTDIGSRPEIKSFFGYGDQMKTQNESGGSPTESTEVGEN